MRLAIQMFKLDKQLNNFILNQNFRYMKTRYNVASEQGC